MEMAAIQYPAEKEKLYPLLATQLRGLIDGVPHKIANLANASALIFDALTEINWAGFYLMEEGQLVLGPFQGKPACIEIAVGRGVCGTAVAENKTQLVKNVHEFPGHIPCDGASNSEIVVPIRDGEGTVIGVLDIDSPIFERFDEEDQKGLEELVRIIETMYK